MREMEGRRRFVARGGAPVEAVQAPIVCNQIEYHVMLDQSLLLGAMRRIGLAVIAHVPLAQGRLAAEPVLPGSGCGPR